jgi:carboxyl-terminal processing protease
MTGPINNVNRYRSTIKRARLVILTAILLLLMVCVAPAPAADPGSCQTCGMIWKDTCVPFERNNETAYNQEMLSAYDPIAANLTGIPDLSNKSWSEAFLEMHAILRERYAFSSWKSIEWDGLYRTWSPAIADAERTGDNAAYYRALRGYLFSIPDGHVNIMAADDFGAKYADIGGGYGFAVSRLDSGKVIVSYVANGSSADIAGIRPGDEVLAWNGDNIVDAINATSYIWSPKKPSTEEGILLQQQRFLTRAPVGTPVSITVSNNTMIPSRTLEFTAYDDGYESLTKTTTFLGKQVNDVGVAHSWTDIKPQISNDTVTSRTLPGGYTYIAIYEESYEVYQPFKEAMLAAIAYNTPGIVLDFRFNGGGDDNIASCFAGWFVDKPVFYEYTTKYDPGSRRFAIVSEAWTQPRPDAYHGPVAVLVSPYTLSSGEGVPMVFANTGTGTIISWYGTNGAFGMNSPQAIMPLGQVLFFPDGASLDINGVIQVDSDMNLAGGVSPRIRVPVNEDTVFRSMAGEDVQLTYALDWLARQNEPPVTPTQQAPSGAEIVVIALGISGLVAGTRRWR